MPRPSWLRSCPACCRRGVLRGWIRWERCAPSERSRFGPPVRPRKTCHTFEERTWQAFWRAAVDGQAPAVIAEDLDVTPAAVRKARSRVLHRLRQEVGDLIA